MNKSGFMFYVIGLAAVTLGCSLYTHAHVAEMFYAFLLSISSFLFLFYSRDRKPEAIAHCFWMPALVAIVAGTFSLLEYQMGTEHAPLGWLLAGLIPVNFFWLLFGMLWLSAPVVPKYFEPFNRASAFLIFLLTLNLAYIFSLHSSVSGSYIKVIALAGVIVILQHQLRYYISRDWKTANYSQRTSSSVGMFAFFVLFLVGILLAAAKMDLAGFFLAIGAMGLITMFLTSFVQWFKFPIVFTAPAEKKSVSSATGLEEHKKDNTPKSDLEEKQNY